MKQAIAKSYSNKCRYYCIICLLLIFLTGNLFAQENEIGFDIGYGATTTENGITLIFPFSKDLPGYFQLGFNYYYTPKSSVFNIKTGISYNYKGQNKTYLQYLRTPFGLDFYFGNKVQLIVGAGLYLRYLLTYSRNLKDSDFENSKRRFQLGWEGNIGLGISISKKYNLIIIYQQDFDITKMYEIKRMSPGGSSYTLDVKGYDGFIKIGLKYKL